MSTSSLITPAELARELRVSRSTAYNLIEQGEFRTIKVGVQLRIFRDSLTAYITRQKFFVDPSQPSHLSQSSQAKT